MSGRRSKRSGSLGTEHGTAGPVFLAGSLVKPGIAVKMPLLGDIQDGDIRRTTDFRNSYATILDRWLGGRPDPLLGGRFDPLPLLD